MAKEINILIIGSKNFKNYDFFEEKLYEILGKYFEQNYKILIKEQEKDSVDTFSVRFAKENNCELERCKIEWKLFGKKAAYENIKRLIWGKSANLGADILICFYKRGEREEERIMCKKIIEEFKSVINVVAPIGYCNSFIFIE